MSSDVKLSREQHAFRQDLVDAGFLIPSAVDGLYGHGELFEELRLAFERLFDRVLADLGTVRRMRFPPLLPRRDLETVGYLKSFPHLAGTVFSFVGSEEDAGELDALADQHGDWSRYQQMTDIVLTPAACYPVYPAVARMGRLAVGGVTVDAGGAYVFRHEPSRDPARLQMFHQRELVRLAEPDVVHAWRDDWCERGRALLGSLGLNAEVAVASDPFFGRGGRMFAASQREQELKLELQVPITGDEPTAVASFNYHQAHFAEVFGIRTSDQPAHTACVGFGEERIVLAMLSEHGLEPANWRSEVRELLWPTQ